MTYVATKNFARIALALLAVAGVIVAGVYATGAGASAAQTLGKTKRTPKPLCPDPCGVTGRTTQFQRTADGKSGLFKVEKAGKIVAWSVDMGAPTKEQRMNIAEATATNDFPKKPTAALAIIRNTDGKKFKLKSESPLIELNQYYGESPTFILDQPLTVKPGDVVALTTVNWAPVFSSSSATQGDKWVASRSSDACDVEDDADDLEESRAHRNIGGERRYGCTYTNDRILYRAFFAKD